MRLRIDCHALTYGSPGCRASGSWLDTVGLQRISFDRECTHQPTLCSAQWYKLHLPFVKFRNTSHRQIVLRQAPVTFVLSCSNCSLILSDGRCFLISRYCRRISFGCSISCTK